MYHLTFIGNRTQSNFPRNAKIRRNSSKPAWTNAITSLLFVVSCDRVLGKEAQVVIPTKPCRKPCFAKESGKSCSETSNFIKDEHCNRKSHTSMHPRGMSQHPQWEDEAGLSLFYHLANNNTTQNWTKGFTKKMTHRT